MSCSLAIRTLSFISSPLVWKTTVMHLRTRVIFSGNWPKLNNEPVPITLKEPLPRDSWFGAVLVVSDARARHQHHHQSITFESDHWHQLQCHFLRPGR